MRHLKSGRKFGRKSAHRNAMMSNLVASLVKHERIETTEAKAKELRPLAERTITWAVRLGELLRKDPSERSAEEKVHYLHHLRMAARVLKDREALRLLFQEKATRFVERSTDSQGGYLRVVKTRRRMGDNAPMAIIEFIDFVPQPKEVPEKAVKAAKAAKGEQEAPAAEKK
jgi:large subunit ribosomal protein L17